MTLQERPVPSSHSVAIERLIQIVDTLRLHCPWDKKQTIKTLAPHLLEECYEFVDAVSSDVDSDCCEELGDLLMGVLMVARVAEDHQSFDLVSVCEEVGNKLIRRHPHVYSDASAKDDEEVLKNWEKIKQEEKADKGKKKSALSGVPSDLPALLRAYRVGQKAANSGFDWPDLQGPVEKVEEEWHELQEAIASGDRDAMQDEMGDLLFAVVNMARKLQIEPELALRGTIDRFSQRFEYIEGKLGENLSSASLEEMDVLWNEAKKMKNK